MPLLPRDYRERILALGYGLKKTKAEGADPETGEIVENGFDDNPCAELNNVAIKNLPAWVPDLNLYKCRRRVGRFASYEAVSTWRESTTGKELEQRDLNLKISGRGIKDFGDDRGYSPLDLVMAARSCSLMEAFEWLEGRVLTRKTEVEIDWEKITKGADMPTVTEARDETAGASSDNGADDNSKPKDSPKKKGFDLQPYVIKREQDIEPRDWVYGQHYLRGSASATIGAGAGGKSSLDLCEAISIAVGRDLSGKQQIARPYKVWYHNAEENQAEMDRRIAAICQHYGVDQRQVMDRLFVTCGFDLEIKASTKGKDIQINQVIRERVVQTIAENGIEVVIFDPLAAMHDMEEDNRGLSGLVYDFFAKIAGATNAAMDIVHHVRKGPPGAEIEYTALDSRGGGAFVFGVRSCRVLNAMKKSEAATFDIEEVDRRQYFRVTRDKVNNTRAGHAGWYKFQTVVLDNARPEEGKPADDVGVVTPWTPPSITNPLGMYGQADKNHWRDLVASDDSYGVHPNSKNWFGCEIAKRLDLDLTGKRRDRHRKIAGAILWELVDEGWLKVVIRKGDDRRDHEFLAVGDGENEEPAAN